MTHEPKRGEDDWEGLGPAEEIEAEVLSDVKVGCRPPPVILVPPVERLEADEAPASDG